ncbi:MAG TPA: cell wall hydrolase [Candidatus Paceibacterota bacterium]|nr:cell wall hydrolase [Candidatus Paceibacterota bacterium]
MLLPATTANASSANHSAQAQISCIAQAIYHEARGEPLMGQRLVAKVIVNRSEDGDWPETPCGVVYQPDQFTGFHGVPTHLIAPQIWRVAEAAYEHRLDVPGWASCIQYFATSRQRYMRRVHRVGGHDFGCPES